MGTEAISSRLIARLNDLHTTEATRLVEQFQHGKIDEQKFIASGNNCLARMTRTDSGAALTRTARLFGSSGVSYDSRAMALIGDIGRTPDLSTRNRGADVTAMEGILVG